MKYSVLGKTGLQVSRTAVGGYVFAGVNKAKGWDPYSAEGKQTAISVIHTALDAGINYIDTAPSYGNGHSETIIGEVMKTRRNECFLATKVGAHGKDKAAVIRSVEESLKRLRSDYVDVIQFHGGTYTAKDTDHILNGGPLEALQTLRDQGKVRWLGLTTEDAFSALDLMDSGMFSLVQVCYNLIYQTASLHLLNRSREKGIGVAVMRPMTSGILQRLLEHLEPRWIEAADPYEVCLKFVLSDSRVNVVNIGMRWPEEVKKNVELIEQCEPAVDISRLPRLTAKI
jgi:aryl-alcohol dehydrogenase-like predicted oxidoreductase